MTPGASFCSACGATLAAPGMPAPLPPVATGIAPPPLTAQARVRPTGVTIIGVVTVAFGALALVAALAVMLFFGAMGAFLAMFGDFGGASGAFMGSLAILAGIIILGLAALAIATGLGVLRGSGWAWGAMIVLLALNILGGLGSLAQRDPGGIVTLLLSGAVIWYFFQPDVKAWFGKPT